MKTIFLCLVWVLTAFTATTAFGQNTKDSKQKSTAPSAADALKSIFKGGGEEGGAGAMSMFGGKADVEDSYSFDHNFKMLIESTDSKGRKTEMNMIMYVSESAQQMGMKLEGDESQGLDYTIIDMGKEQMITLMNNDGNKMGMVIKYSEAKMEDVKEGEYTYTFEKTGNKEVISGEMCEEYLLKSNDPKDETRTMIWMAPDGDALWMDAYLRMSKDKKSSWTEKMPESYPEGGLVRVINEDGKNTSVMTVIENNHNQPTTIKTSPYTFMNFGG